MNEDVDDDRERNHRKHDSGMNSRHPHLHNAPLLSKIRNLNHLALSSIGSLFSGPTSSKHAIHSQKDFPPHLNRAEDPGNGGNDDGVWSFPPESTSFEDEDLTPLALDYNLAGQGDYYSFKQTGFDGPTSYEESRPSGTSRAHISRRFVEPRDSSVNHARRLPHRGPLYACNRKTLPLSQRLHGLALPSSNAAGDFVSTNSGVSPTGDLETPPLTPDSLSNQVLSPSSVYLDSTGWYHDSSPSLPEFPHPHDVYEVKKDDGDGALYIGPQLQEVREGKKPERSTGMKDNSISENDPCLENTAEMENSPLAIDDQEEWYGLEYTLELSSRERQPSDTQSFSAGEHSRSRESWAAIHRGAIHPFFEDEDYRQWKNWHRFLDWEDEHKKHKKGHEFKAQSKELAWVFVEEMRTRDVLNWQKDVYGVVSKELKERLIYLVRSRPDPYFPQKKHGKYLALKRSRSIAALRELRPRNELEAAQL